MIYDRNIFAIDTIAGAVAREIICIERNMPGVIEGTAYKAAWDRKGSDALKHIKAAEHDMGIMHSYEFSGHAIERMK